MSYFDHDSPNFLKDGLVITATGLRAAVDVQHHASDFPAYWNTGLRQFVYYDGHNGYDYNLSYVPIHAAAAGKVIFAGWEYPNLPDHGYGRMVMIDHHNGYITLYGHLSQFQVKKGHRVKRGQIIGISGNTGHSTGPHLHFTVFHNCTPTDPYGWTGSGPDPLESYQGELSTYLWLRQPLVTNPLPQMPGLGELPSPTGQRYLLLKLPSPAHGTQAFTSALQREARRVIRALHLAPSDATVDMIRGVIKVTGPITASAIYALPDVASIGSRDVLEDARVDVLSAVARAALVTPHKSVSLGKLRKWSGYVFQWLGRTFLVGKGPKDRKVNLRLAGRRHTVTVRSLHTDPTSGTYAADLGKLTSGQVADLIHALEQPSSGKSSFQVQPARRVAVRPRQSRVTRSQQGLDGYLLSALLLMGLVGVVVVALRPRSAPTSRAG